MSTTQPAHIGSSAISNLKTVFPGLHLHCGDHNFTITPGWKAAYPHAHQNIESIQETFILLALDA